MIHIDKKRLFGLIGAPRAGKDEVARYLFETRGFEQYAFADQIKEEFGISKEDFEAAKICGNIDDLRNKLWAFSDEIKKKNPLYFIEKVMEKVNNSCRSAIITDVRTEEELSSILSNNGRIYFIKGRKPNESRTVLDGSKLSLDNLNKLIITDQVRIIENNLNGVYSFYKKLDKFFFVEDLLDLPQINRENIIVFINQFSISQKGW